jgi:hypothetical protein
VLVLERYWLARGKGVKNIGIEVRSVWPDDRAELGVNPDLLEFGGILEWFKYASELYERAKVYIGLDAVFETKMEHVGREGADLDDVFEHGPAFWSSRCRVYRGLVMGGFPFSVSSIDLVMGSDLDEEDILLLPLRVGDKLEQDA